MRFPKVAGLLSFCAMAIAANAATLTEAQVQKLMPVAVEGCQAARASPELGKVVSDFDQFCKCTEQRVAGFLREGAWQSPGALSDADKKQFDAFLMKAGAVCARPFYLKKIEIGLVERCATAEGRFRVLAEKGREALKAACQCVATTTMSQVVIPHETDIMRRKDLDTKTVMAEAITSCQPK